MGPINGHHDALVVGLGFGGLYSLYLLKKQGLDVVAVEAGADVGGTWYWNRYPGARSDVESHTYRFSWDRELLKTSPWPYNYLVQSELQAYFQEVARKHDLYPLIQFNSELKAAAWDDNNSFWKLKTSTGEEFTARYLVTALGILNNAYIPDLPGLNKFKGKLLHTSQWNSDVQHEGKRIGVIGTGASGVQVVSGLSPKAGTLTNFIRHAQYVLPAQYRKVSTEEREELNQRYDKHWDQVFSSAVGFGFPEPPVPAFSVSDEERERIFEDLWNKGSGFRFLFGGFSDLCVNEAANKEAVNFIHKKIRGIVKDPQKADVLTSNDWFARRPLTDDNYYSSFNQDNVFAVDLKKTPITEVTENGIKTEDGKLHELDLLILGTGFSAVDGSYYRIDFKGRNGKSLEKHWEGAPATQLGITTSEFPNLFFINGPGAPFANNPPVCEIGAEFAADLIARAETIRKKGQGSGAVESTREADEEWLKTCQNIAQMTLFSKTPSWFFGENVPGRKVSPRFFFGGIANWRKALENSKHTGYAGWKFEAEPSATVVGVQA